MFRIEPLDLRIGGCDRLHPACEQAVHAAQNSVLLMHNGRHIRAGGGKDRRQRGVAAETDHCTRFEAVEQTQSHAAALENRHQSLEPGERISAEPPRRNDMRGQEVGLAGNLGAARIGNQRDMVSAPFQLGSQRKGGQKVPARAASGEDIVAICTGHGCISRRAEPVWSFIGAVCPKPSLSPSPLVLLFRNGLRRVTASISPTLRQIAIVDDPP